MRTTVCTITKGAQSVRASVSTESPQARGEVVYEGDAALLPYRPTQVGNAMLVNVLESVADEVGAEFSAQESGEYKCWAR